MENLSTAKPIVQKLLGKSVGEKTTAHKRYPEQSTETPAPKCFHQICTTDSFKAEVRIYEYRGDETGGKNPRSLLTLEHHEDSIVFCVTSFRTGSLTVEADVESLDYEIFLDGMICRKRAASRKLCDVYMIAGGRTVEKVRIVMKLGYRCPYFVKKLHD